MRILLADDHAVVRRGLREIILEEFPRATIGEAQDGLETITHVRTCAWDILVLDINMPNGNGLEVLGIVKSLRPELAVLMLSMSPEDQYAIRVMKAGAAGYLTKETAPDELIVAIRKIMEHGRYINEALGMKLASYLNVSTDKPPHELLSDREYAVLCLIVTGKRLKQIAEELSVSPKTVSTYRARIMRKLGLNCSSEIIRYGIDAGIAG